MIFVWKEYSCSERVKLQTDSHTLGEKKFKEDGIDGEEADGRGGGGGRAETNGTHGAGGGGADTLGSRNLQVCLESAARPGGRQTHRNQALQAA